MLNSIQPLIECLRQHPQLTIITATSRLSRRLLHFYNEHQLRSGLTAWPTPDILSWSAWVQRQWQTAVLQSGSSQIALTSTQSRHIWQAIIEAETAEPDDGLINSQSTAQKAQAARQQIIDYRLDISDESSRQWFVYDADASRWLQWHQKYTRTLQQNNWLDNPAITQELIEQIVSDQIDTEYSSCFIGFDELTPLQRQLQAWLESKDRWVTLPVEGGIEGNAALLACDNPLQEIERAVIWARNQFENHWRPGDAPIGIVVPKLEQNRQQIERVFRQVFYPEDGLQTLRTQPLHTQGIRENAIFNLSLGYSLKQEPMIDVALKILSLCRRSFSYEDFSQVLLSPFIKNADEQCTLRSSLDNYLRQKVAAELSLHGLIVSLPTQDDSGEGGEENNEVHALLTGLSTLKQGWKHKADASSWVTNFQQCLSLFGLLKADEEYQTSYQFQVMQSLDEVWFEFSRFSLVNDAITLDQAITIFTQMVNSQIFQSGAAELPIQILGVLESAGMQFKSLCLMGMTEQNWPPPANPNPFIPLRLQREHNMPHSSPQREFDYASQQTERLLQAAEHIVLSYPRGDGEEIFVPSPLVANFPPLGGAVINTPELEMPDMESLLDEQGPAVDTASYQTGSNALKDQSQCPFRAFVVHRLKSKPPEEPQPGNDPRQRGSLVHRVMELLWKAWQSSDSLRALDDEQLSIQISETIDHVIQSEWTGANKDYESKRLHALIMEWLEQEKQRQPFSIRALEQETITEINQLKLKLYIDRIDELADGSLCIVDYKTGLATANDWLGERPEEPQLPLYTLTQTEDVNAVAFANIRAGESRYIGVTKEQPLMGVDEKTLKEIKQIPITKGTSLLKHYESWEDMHDEWRETIYQLADEHVKGHAQIDPKNYPQTCNYCDVSSVCRLFDSNEDWQEEEEQV